MNRIKAPIPFAGSILKDRAQICAFFSSTDEAHHVLLRFVKERLELGENTLNARTLALVAIFLVCFVGRILALDPTSHITQYGHTVWRVQDGYFGGVVVKITQTTDGYIWVGTKAGLLRFDGVRFVRWKAEAGEDLPSSDIDSLLGARDGSLWIGTALGLAHLVNKKLIVYQKNEGWIARNIIEDRDGKIWFNRFRPDEISHPLCQVLDTSVRCYGREDGFDIVNPTVFAQDALGDWWIGGSTSLLHWQPGASKLYQPQSLRSNPGVGVQALLPATDGSLWVGMIVAGRGAGLERLVDGALMQFHAPTLNGETLKVVSLFHDDQNNVWVGTFNNGLYRIHDTDVEHYGSAEGLSGDYVTAIFEDREGDLWVATTQGLDMFRDLRVKSISKREGLDSEEVQSVAASQEGNVWIGTGRLHLLGPHGISLDPGKTLPGNLVAALFVDHADRLWAGIMNKLFVYEQGSFREIAKRDGSPLGMAMGITEDSEHNIWVESKRPQGVLIRIREFKVDQEFPETEIPLARKIVADAQAGIWLGLTTGDLALFRDGQIETFTFPNHPHTRVLAITRASDGAILGATAFGVVAWKNGKRQLLTVQNGLPCNTVNALISDNAGNLWLDSVCGLIEIPTEQIELWWEHPESKLKLRVFDTFDGARPGLGFFNTSAQTPDGRLWFANGNVAQVIDPAHIPQNTVAPSLDISALIADRKSYPPELGIRLPPRTRDLEIDYAALSYVAPQKVLFRYRLEGHDVDWLEPGTRRQAFYNDLRPGHYRFRVIACNNDGVWNEAGASLNFSVLPAYYQTAWFRACCAGAVLLLLWAIYQFRVRQLHQQFAITLDARVHERTRIARELHDTLLQSFNALLLRFQAASDLFSAHSNDEAKRVLDSTIDQAGQALIEGRDAVQQLRSTVVADDLVSAIGSLGEALAANGSNGDAPAFHVEVQGTPRELFPLARDEVYRIAGEALRNSFQHAEARRLEVEIRYDTRQLRLRFRDDGKGIDPQLLRADGLSGHYGLRGMRERAQLLGGTLTIWSEVNSGTEIDLSIPAFGAYTKSGVSGFWLRARGSQTKS